MTISTHVSASRRTGNYTIEDLTGVFQFTSPQGDELCTFAPIYFRQCISTHVSARRRT